MRNAVPLGRNGRTHDVDLPFDQFTLDALGHLVIAAFELRTREAIA